MLFALVVVGRFSRSLTSLLASVITHHTISPKENIWLPLPSVSLSLSLSFFVFVCVRYIGTLCVLHWNPVCFLGTDHLKYG